MYICRPRNCHQRPEFKKPGWVTNADPYVDQVNQTWVFPATHLVCLKGILFPALNSQVKLHSSWTSLSPRSLCSLRLNAENSCTRSHTNVYFHSWFINPLVYRKSTKRNSYHKNLKCYMSESMMYLMYKDVTKDFGAARERVSLSSSQSVSAFLDLFSLWTIGKQMKNSQIPLGQGDIVK